MIDLYRDFAGAATAGEELSLDEDLSQLSVGSGCFGAELARGFNASSACEPSSSEFDKNSARSISSLLISVVIVVGAGALGASRCDTSPSSSELDESLVSEELLARLEKDLIWGLDGALVGDLRCSAFLRVVDIAGGICGDSSLVGDRGDVLRGLFMTFLASVSFKLWLYCDFWDDSSFVLVISIILLFLGVDWSETKGFAGDCPFDFAASIATGFRKLDPADDVSGELVL